MFNANRRLLSFIAAILTMFSVSAPRLALTQEAASNDDVILILDRSGSMTGRKLASLKEAAKLAIFLLDSRQRVTVVDFQSTVNKRGPFRLDSESSRDEVMRHIDSLRANGGTDYLAALASVKDSPNAPWIFISDGLPDQGATGVLAYLKKTSVGKIYTVGVETTTDAQQLLAEMAARTGGSAAVVEHAEDLTKVLLKLAQELGNYRVFKPEEEPVSLSGVAGKLIAIGYDATPDLNAPAGQPQGLARYHAALPGEQVSIVTCDDPTPQNFTIQSTNKRTQRGRIAAILRQDQSRSLIVIDDVGGVVPAGEEVVVGVKFNAPDGTPIDPRKEPGLSAVIDVLDKSGHVTSSTKALPNATSPALQARVKAPSAAGPFGIRVHTEDSRSGQPFRDEHEQSLIAVEAAPITVTPSPLALTVKDSQFDANLQVQAGITATFTAHLVAPVEGLRLVETRCEADELTLSFSAESAAIFHGKLRVVGTGAAPLASVDVPFEFTIVSRVGGIALPERRVVQLGVVPANSGPRTLATWSIPGRDEVPTPYSIRVTDLSDGSTIIELKASPDTIEPTKDAAASLGLTADIGNVAAGEYQAAIVIQSELDAKQRWESRLQLTISEALSAKPLEFGNVEVGSVVTTKLRLRNLGGILRDVPLAVSAVTCDGKPVDSSEIVLTVPASIAVVPPQQEAAVEVKLAVSPLASKKGPHRAEINLTRAPSAVIRVPITFEVVKIGGGDSKILPSPEKVSLISSPGKAVRFEVRLQLDADVDGPNELTATAGDIIDSAEKVVDCSLTLEWPKGRRLGRKGSITLKGYLLAPDKPGTYTGKLTVRSQNAGSKIVPLTIVVQ